MRHVRIPEDCPRCGSWVWIGTRARQPADGCQWAGYVGDIAWCDACGLRGEVGVEDEDADEPAVTLRWPDESEWEREEEDATP